MLDLAGRNLALPDPVEIAVVIDPRTAPRRSRPERSGTQRRWGRVARVVALALAMLLFVVGVVTVWALNRYVIDHVEVADVAAYEQQVRGDTASASDIGLANGATASDELGTTSSALADPDVAASETDQSSSASAASEEAASDAGAEPVVTDSSYTDDALSVSITTVVEGSGNDQVTYFVADVVVTDPTQVQAGFANNQFGQNIIADTSDIAAQYDAVLAINGDYYGFRDTGIVIRNGVIYRDDGARDGLVMYADGTMAVYDETTTSADELLAAGAWNTWSFGPALVSDGVILDGIDSVEVDTNIGNHSVQGNQPRTGIGIIDANHYVFVVVDGRSPGYSKGVTMTEFAQIFTGLGATAAYNLDGGGSSTLVFNGEVINNPLGKGNERGTSDIIYVS